MVKKTEKGGAGGAEAVWSTGKAHSTKCIGAVCYNPDTGKLQIELQRGSCHPGVIKGIVENIVQGVEVEFVLPRPEGEGVKS